MQNDSGEEDEEAYEPDYDEDEELNGVQSQPAKPLTSAKAMGQLKPIDEKNEEKKAAEDDSNYENDELEADAEEPSRAPPKKSDEDEEDYSADEDQQE